MKRIIYSLIVIAFLFGCATPKGSVSKKDVPKYVPFKEFKGDTAAYLVQSIENRKQYYIGRKFKVLLNDIEMPVLSCTLSTNYLKYKGRVVNGGGGFYFSNYKLFIRNKVFGHEGNAHSLFINFDPPYADNDTMIKMLRRHDGRWWNEESRKILEELIVTDLQYSNWDIPVHIGK